MQLAAMGTSTSTKSNTTTSVFDAFGTVTTTNSSAAATTSSVFDPFGTMVTTTPSSVSSEKTDHFSTIKSTSSIITGPTDFKDDPFKNYRYEDPFNIKDPFDDDDEEFSTDPDKVFKDDVIVATEGNISCA